MKDEVKLYKFFQLPRDDDSRDGLAPEDMYKLYAFTSSKKYAKTFREQRDMTQFVETVFELSQDEYVKFANEHRGNALGEYPYSYFKSYPKKRGESPEYGKAIILSTWYERETCEDFTTSSELEDMYFVCSVNPFVINKKYMKAFVTLELLGFWKLLISSGKLDAVVSKLQPDDAGLVDDYSYPDVAYDNLSIFIGLYGDTFNFPL